MNQQWEVCELEESTNISLTHFERYSVVSVPESWILLLDGILVCFWPSIDPGKKIRSLHRPKVDEKCVYYKCRVLLDGAKFSTYKKAKEAELIAQNVSSIMDSSVLLGSQNVENICESTMDFDVSDVSDTEEIDDNADPKGSAGFNVSVNEDIIVGHDSFEYNKAMMNRPYLSKKAMAMAFEVENIPGEFLQEGVNETTLSYTCDYSADFKFKGADFLTSTVVDDKDFSPSTKRVQVSDALSTIAAVELKLASFVNDILNDLNNSKEILRQMENGRESSVQEREETTSNKVATIAYQQPASKDEERFSNGIEELNVQRERTGELPLKSQPTVIPVEEIHYDDASNDIQNATQSVRVSDPLNVQRPEILSIEYISCTQNVPVDVVPVSHVLAVPFTESVLAPVESQPTNVIRLPIDSTGDHAKIEDLLDEDGFEAALVNHLVPLTHENETNYMNRTILLVFTKNFFLTGVSWKKQSGRINIKNSSLLCCWMESYRKTFDANVDSEKFQKHFRRVKSALRAAIKAELKRKLDENVKSEKMQNGVKKPRKV